ncbi:hypothetical protein PIB30_099724 [Stylosanthes scabra]|uniref:Uncharacterized protein n=1 Tax=Stylosanthes scabra TaxID=79078 RepID=A0ABU6QZG4_9FABA|nr:hypothetical protein [Stylosanthes scabra]
MALFVSMACFLHTHQSQLGFVHHEAKDHSFGGNHIVKFQNASKTPQSLSFASSLRVVGKEVLFEVKSSTKASKRADSGDQSLERWGGGPARPL